MKETLILNGKELANNITQELKEIILNLNQEVKFKIIQVGDLEASNKYIRNKLKKAQEIGIEAQLVKLNENIAQDELEKIIIQESQNADGVILQLPLPNNLNTQKALDCIPQEKDIDGLTTKNKELFYSNSPLAFAPATARGIMLLLQRYNIKIENKKTYVIGESDLVGKPTKKLFEMHGGITKSFNIETGISLSEEADILIVAAGSHNLVGVENVKENAVVVDVGINTLSNNKIAGDVQFENVKNKVRAISPVPGGVGPMTVISLLFNLVERKLLKQNKSK